MAATRVLVALLLSLSWIATALAEDNTTTVTTTVHATASGAPELVPLTGLVFTLAAAIGLSLSH